MYVENSLESIKLKKYSDATIFFDEFEKAVNEFKATGAKVTEQEKLNYMLKALPRSYSYIGDLIDVLPEKDKTVEYLKSKIKLKALEEKNESASNDEMIKSNTFTAVKSTSDGKKQNGYKCEKIGHFQKDCYQANTSSYRGKQRCGQYQGNCGRFQNNRGQYQGRGTHHGGQGSYETGQGNDTRDGSKQRKLVRQK